MMVSHHLYPPEHISPSDAINLKNIIYDWADSHGLVVRAPPPVTASHGSSCHEISAAPQTLVPAVTLYPSYLPKDLFTQALEIQQAFNELYAAVSSDEIWLENVLKDVFETDEFVKLLWSTHQSAKHRNRLRQPVGLGLFRSDYMINVEDNGDAGVAYTLKQVEFNTIAASFAGLSVEVGKLHRYLRFSRAYSHSGPSPLTGTVPVNTAGIELANGINAAHAHFIGSRPESESQSPPFCVIVIFQPGERNVIDQKKIEYNISAPVFRIPFDQVIGTLRLDENQNLLHSHNGSDYNVSVVYWRAAYSPDDYNFHGAWDARLLVEQSTAIKCPDILTQLAGTKKVQQVLATPGTDHLSRFLQDSKVADKVRDTFVSMYPLDDSPLGKVAHKLALNPETAVNYVLKPQREGGGNNIYRDAIPGFLSNLPKEQWKSYILMELIKPPEQSNHILRNGQIHSGPVIVELGVYGTCIWDRAESSESGKSIKVKDWARNDTAGYLVRTKPESSDEGGVASGFGSLDSCIIE